MHPMDIINAQVADLEETILTELPECPEREIALAVLRSLPKACARTLGSPVRELSLVK